MIYTGCYFWIKNNNYKTKSHIMHVRHFQQIYRTRLKLKEGIILQRYAMISGLIVAMMLFERTRFFKRK